MANQKPFLSFAGFHFFLSWNFQCYFQQQQTITRKREREREREKGDPFAYVDSTHTHTHFRKIWFPNWLQAFLCVFVCTSLFFVVCCFFLLLILYFAFVFACNASTTFHEVVFGCAWACCFLGICERNRFKHAIICCLCTQPKMKMKRKQWKERKTSENVLDCWVLYSSSSSIFQHLRFYLHPSSLYLCSWYVNLNCVRGWV